MSIQCEDLADLIAVCKLLVVEGLTFRTDTGSLLITLTGGY